MPDHDSKTYGLHDALDRAAELIAHVDSDGGSHADVHADSDVDSQDNGAMATGPDGYRDDLVGDDFLSGRNGDLAGGRIGARLDGGTDSGVPGIGLLERTRHGGMSQSLIDVGWFAVKQFEVMLAFTETQAEALTLIPDVIDRANAYGSASPAAVGAAASLVDLVRSDDVFEIIDAITSARHLIGDPDLAAGVAAFIASLTEQIGLIAEVDPAVVHDELCRGVPRAQPAQTVPGHVAQRTATRTKCARWATGALRVA